MTSRFQSAQLELIKTMNSHLQNGFSAVQAAHAVQASLSRHDIFKNNATENVLDIGIKALLAAAISDVGSVAFSAWNKVRLTSPDDRLGIVRRSLGLLSIASLSTPNEQGFFHTFKDVSMSDNQPLNLIDSSHLVVARGEHGLEVQYEAEPQTYIEACVRNNPGCPAQGAIMKAFYQKYVEVVLA